jgi:predicted RNase H-like HicB family nuclease
MTYTIFLTPGSGRVAVRVPAMPGIFTWGDAEDGAIEAARKAIQLHLEGYRERGQPYPQDRTVRLPLERKRGRAALAREAVVIPSPGKKCQAPASN